MTPNPRIVCADGHNGEICLATRPQLAETARMGCVASKDDSMLVCLDQVTVVSAIRVSSNTGATMVHFEWPYSGWAHLCLVTPGEFADFLVPVRSEQVCSSPCGDYGSPPIFERPKARQASRACQRPVVLTASPRHPATAPPRCRPCRPAASRTAGPRPAASPPSRSSGCASTGVRQLLGRRGRENGVVSGETPFACLEV